MNRTYPLVVIAAACLLLTSCSDSPQEDPNGALSKREAQRQKALETIMPVLDSIVESIENGSLSRIEENWASDAQLRQLNASIQLNRKEKEYLLRNFRWIAEEIARGGSIQKKELIGPYVQDYRVGIGYHITDAKGKTHEVAFLFFRFGDEWRIVEKGPN